MSMKVCKHCGEIFRLQWSSGRKVCDECKKINMELRKLPSPKANKEESKNGRTKPK